MSAEISDALRAHVSNNMPIRLLQLPSMKLLGRGEIFNHLLPNMTDITDQWLEEKEKTTEWDDIQFVASKQERRQYLIGKAIQERAQYAILSHTWLVNDREVVYPDWVSQKNLTGVGYDKVVNFARVVHQNHGMTLAWLDTLCINKESTAELDESIRSMYRWYYNSALCIVILADTKAMSEIPKDRWFTRGWTLQELMAPRRVKFYAKDWEMFMDGYNDKGAESSSDGDGDGDGEERNATNNMSVFGPLIEEAAGIASEQLLSFDPSATRRDIPTRMSWASKRVTTREEDRAYCLMGIFGVSFSIAYGEGRERAFFRLLEAILNTYRDVLAILDWAGKPIGKDVHATGLLPSGPECYNLRLGEPRLESYDWENIQDYVPFSFAPKEPMTPTHLGLRVDLYCIPATVVGIEGSYTVSMQPGAKFCEKPIPIRVYPHNVKRFNRDEEEGYGNEFLFGIWTFERDSQDAVYLPDEPCRAFLLESMDPYQPIDMPRVWRKVDTPETIRIAPDSPWEADWDMSQIKMRTFIL